MKKFPKYLPELIAQSALEKMTDPNFIKTLSSFTSFKLSDLFESEIWESFDPVARRLAGKKFKKYINNQPYIKFVEIDITNHSTYKLN
ncbi:DUF1413 domain-containing protein [Ligilactobacillus animalis]|uniref:DUF1413 domain-containing protein n=1 Tax=Ligilactobacillus animalis TaxID=1605 RepID=UPI00259550C9|nr:DUF1413 domain-containing protein [Ligilactobacillus animalis]